MNTVPADDPLRDMDPVARLALAHEMLLARTATLEERLAAAQAATLKAQQENGELEHALRQAAGPESLSPEVRRLATAAETLVRTAREVLDHLRDEGRRQWMVYLVTALAFVIGFVLATLFACEFG